MLRGGKLTGDGKRGAVCLRRRAAVHQPRRCATSEWRAGHAGQRRHHPQEDDPRRDKIPRPRTLAGERSLKPAGLYAARRVGYTHPDRSFATLPVAGELRPGMRQHAGWTHRVGDGSLSTHRSAREWISAVFSCLLSSQQVGCIGLDRRQIRHHAHAQLTHAVAHSQRDILGRSEKAESGADAQPCMAGERARDVNALAPSARVDIVRRVAYDSGQTAIHAIACGVWCRQLAEGAAHG